MAFKKRKPLHDWRSQLTAEEAREVKKLDRQIAASRKVTHEASQRLAPIRNRAIQRCRYQDAQG